MGHSTKKQKAISKKLRILGILTHYKLRRDRDGKEVCRYAGVDYARLVQPLTYLAKDPAFDVDIEYEVAKGKSLEEFLSPYDIIFSSYIDNPVRYVQIRVTANKLGIKWVLDIDDNLWDVHPTHPHYKDYSKGSESFFNKETIIKDMDHITVTNRFLKYQIMKNTGKPHDTFEILPNFVDLTRYDYKKVKRAKSDIITIGYIGGSSHLPDITKPEFTEAVGEIMQRYPNVRLLTSFFMPQLKALYGYKYRYYLGLNSVERFIDELWPKMIGESDIVVAPLSWSKYSRSKSYIKYLEYSAGKAPGIYEAIDPYEEILQGSEGRGFLAKTKADWVKHLTYLIENPEARQKIGENAYDYVKKEHTVQKNYKMYADYFKRICVQP